MQLINRNFFSNYFIILFSIIPLTMILGPSVSLINIVLIDLSFICYYAFFDKSKFQFDITVKILLFLCLYLIFNSFIALDFNYSFKRNMGFIRFVIFFIALNYFLYNNKNFNKIFYFWFITILIMSLDVFIDVLFGLSTLEFISLILDPPIHEYQKVLFQNTFSNRIVSFFIDEPVVGAFINGFYFISCGYLLFNYENSNNKKKLFIILIILIISIPVFLTGERSNSIKLLFGFSIFFLFYRNLTIKKKLVGFFTFLILIITIINFSSNLKVRFKSQLLENFQSKEKLISFYDNSIYFKLYRSGFSVFKNYPLFGVGNKNYRTETCHDSEKYSINYLCSTHPHQIYIEFLSEHGLIGSLIIMSVFFYLIFKLLGQIIKSRNYIQIGSFTYLIIVFLPILPGGSFFSDFNLTLFWINFSTLYASNKETNIFTTSNNNRIK